MLFEFLRRQTQGAAGEVIHHKDGQIDAERRVRAGLPVGFNDLLGNLQDFHHADQGDEAGGFDHPGDQVDGQGNQPPYRLGQDDPPVYLGRFQPQRFRAFALDHRNAADRAADQVRHFRGSPEGENNHGGHFAGKVPSESPGCAEIHQEQQYHLRHDVDNAQPDPQDRRAGGTLPAGGNPQQNAGDHADSRGNQADAECDPEAFQQPGEIPPLPEDFKSQIRHGAASFPAGCPAGTAKMFKFNTAKKRTLSIEVGMQNAGLGTNLAMTFFVATNPMAVVPCAISCAWHSISGTILANIFARQKAK